MNPKSALLLAVAILFCSAFPEVAPAASSPGTQATFVRMDTTTQGNWKGVYGLGGYTIPATNSNQAPTYAAFTPENEGLWTWAATGTAIQDLQVPGSAATVRQASCWYSNLSNTFALDVNVSDGGTHQFALYALDWDLRGRAETIQAVDAATGTVLDTRSVSNFSNGIFFVWNVSGHVTFNVTSVSGPNAVISGAFFDVATANTASGIAHFVTADTSTQGNWQGAYGADGYSLAGDKQSIPAYAALTPQNQLSWTWAASSTDTRALELASGAGRIAATWFNMPGFSVDVNITDGGSHQIAFYAIDWDYKGRTETIQVVDAQTNSLLDSRSLFSFTSGTYLVWTVSGHVRFNVTATGGPNAVVSGVFFGAGGSVPPPITVPVVSNSNPPPPSDPNCPPAINAVAFNGIDTTTQGAWKGIGNFNAPPASSSLVYGKDGVILPDTEGCDQACNPFPSYVSFGPRCVNSATPGNLGGKPYSTHAYVAMLQGAPSVMGAEPQNTSNTGYFQCNFTESNPAIPWALMVAWRPVVDTRELSDWYTCPNITSFYLEFSFGNSTHNFEVYVADDQNGKSRLRSEEIQVLDGDTNAVLYDSGSFTNFTGGVYYKWSITGHVKVNVINTSTTGTNAVINGAFFN
jgi:hypothetical protein